MIDAAIKKDEITLKDLDGIAVTYGSGLAKILLVGVAETKAFSFTSGILLIEVIHIEGHINANYIENKTLELPFVCLVARVREILRSSRFREQKWTEAPMILVSAD